MLQEHRTMKVASPKVLWANRDCQGVPPFVTGQQRPAHQRRAPQGRPPALLTGRLDRSEHMLVVWLAYILL
jgi:hypothetical protein